MVSTLPSKEVQHSAGEAPPRTIARRSGLPSGRAVLGAFLMVVAALGVFLAYTGATDDERRPFVIAARDVPAGNVVGADDLTTALLDLDAGVGSVSFVDPSLVVGQRLIAPLTRGELVQASALSSPLAEGPGNDFTFRIGASRAVNGDLRAGDLIDIYVTTDDGTRSVAEGLPLLSAPIDAGRGELILRLAVGDDATVVAVIDAVNRGDVTVVRSTHAASRAGDAVAAGGTEEPSGSDPAASPTVEDGD